MATRLPLWAAMTLLGIVFVRSAGAALIVYETPAGALQGSLPVSARATFTTSANQVHIVLENLQADPKSVVQCLSGLEFTLDSGQTSGSLQSSLGQELSIAGTLPTDVSLSGMSSTGWSLATVGSSLKLNLLGTPTAPDHTIIGPPAGSGAYANANNSITGGTHSPFLSLSATFTLDVPGVTSTSRINSAIFQFNTSPGSETTGVPEPASPLLVGAMLILTMMRRSTR